MAPRARILAWFQEQGEARFQEQGDVRLREQGDEFSKGMTLR